VSQTKTVLKIALLTASLYSCVLGTNFQPLVAVQSIPDEQQSAQSQIDSAATQTPDQSMQDNFDDLFADSLESIDTTAWSASKINTVWFDYRTMHDTAYIPLIDSSRNLRFTCPNTGEVTSAFGPRHRFWHLGIDTRLRVGDTVRCAFYGKVRVIQNDRHGFGKVVVVRHCNGLETLYGHLSKVLVSVNQQLGSGEVVGLGGNTGRSTGSHLHFETRYRGEPFNPCTIIDFEKYTLLTDTIKLTQDDFRYLAEVRSTIHHKIRRGETLGSIARSYSTSVRKLCALNGIKPRTLLRVGRKIIIRKGVPVQQGLANNHVDSDNAPLN
jgi:hypothetical protein